MSERCPSDVFLELWRARGLQTSEAFRECAEAWLQIRDMELMASIERMKSTPKSGEKVRHERVEKVHAPTPENTPEAGADPSADEGAKAVQNGPPARDLSAIGRSSLATRKRNAMEKVEELRASGVGMGKIADADKDLTVVTILDFLDRKPIPLPKLAAIERAIRKLEAET